VKRSISANNATTLMRKGTSHRLSYGGFIATDQRLMPERRMSRLSTGSARVAEIESSDCAGAAESGLSSLDLMLSDDLPLLASTLLSGCKSLREARMQALRDHMPQRISEERASLP
jgi:hypothetical protein